MHTLEWLVPWALLAGVVACGGAVDDGEALEAAADPAAIDPADPDVLPTGLYASKVIAASCNVNDAYQRGDRMVIVRRGAGANIPLPSRPGVAATVSSGTPRTDSALTKTTTKWTMQNEEMCPGGSIVGSLTMTELTATHVKFLYREEPRDCVHSTCTIDFELDLLERACAPARDPGCSPGPMRMAIGDGVTQDVECECATP